MNFKGEREILTYCTTEYLVKGSSSFSYFNFYFANKNPLHAYSNHNTSEFPGQGVDSSSKGNLNKKIIFTGAVRSQNSCSVMKTCWNEFIAICLYFANQLNQTPQIYSNMRKIFKLFVFCPFSTRNSQCQCFCQFECSSIAVNSFVHSLWGYTYATSNPRYQHHAKKPTVNVRILQF